LSALAAKTVDAIDPDGTLGKEQLNSDRRHFTLRQTKDGAYIGELRLTGALGAKLTAILSPSAKPRVEKIILADGMTSRDALDADIRSHGQRMQDALEEVCDRVLRAGRWSPCCGRWLCRRRVSRLVGAGLIQAERQARRDGAPS
jgi:hypothetical protein